MEKTKVIELKNVSFGYDENLILKDVNMTINSGDFVGIIGNNGSGKSTLLKLITRLIKPKKGAIFIEKLNYSYVEQVTSNNDITFPATVWEIVSLGLRRKWFLWTTKAEKQQIDKVLKLLNIYKYKNSQINELSGGEQQKVQIAKALVYNPDVLILDEPTCGIDKDSEHELIDIIHKLNEKEHKTIIFVSHKIEHLGKATKIYSIRNQSIFLDEQLVEDCCHGGEQNVCL